MNGEDSINELTSLLRQVLSDLTHTADRVLSGRALTLAKSMPLLVLLDGERHTPSSIARRVQCDAGAMTRILVELEEKGLVARERSLDDRRVVHLHLTAAGLELARDVPAALQEAMEARLSCLAKDEAQMLTKLLRRVGAESTRIS